MSSLEDRMAIVAAQSPLSRRLATGAFGIDQLLVRDTAIPVTPGEPGRMGANTAVAFLSIAGALLLAHARHHTVRITSQLTAVLCAAVGAISIIGYAM